MDADTPQPSLTAAAGGRAGGAPVVSEDTCAGGIVAGDRLLLDDGIVGVVLYVQDGRYWLPDDLGHGASLCPGVLIDWKQDGGNASGTLIRAPGDMLQLVTGGAG